MASAVPPELPPDVLSKVEVLAGGGEMGALMHAFDWSTTPLGPVSGWPQSLRTALSILLASVIRCILPGDQALLSSTTMLTAPFLDQPSTRLL